MRDKISVFYYPDFWPDQAALIKSIILFDEIHFADRPSFMFGTPTRSGEEIGNFGTIAAPSPMRQFEQSFRDNGIPVYVHGIQGGPISGDRLEDSIADITDLTFLNRFRTGLVNSPRFRELIVPAGANYGPQTAAQIVNDLNSVNLAELPEGGPLAVLRDPTVRPFDSSTPLGAAKMLIIQSALISAKLNFAFDVSSKHGLIPLADAQPFCELLQSRYLRAMRNGSAQGYPATAVDLSFNIFQRVLPDGIEQLKMVHAIAYRKASSSSREAFLEFLLSLTKKLGDIASDEDYRTSVERIIEKDVLPAATEYKNSLVGIRDTMFGSLIKDTLKVAAATGAIQIFADLSWIDLLRLSGGGAVALAKAGIDALIEKRKVKRESALSYLLDINPPILP